MITSLIALGAIALWTSIATLEVAARDGYGQVPDLAIWYSPLP